MWKNELHKLFCCVYLSNQTLHVSVVFHNWDKEKGKRQKLENVCRRKMSRLVGKKMNGTEKIIKWKWAKKYRGPTNDMVSSNKNDFFLWLFPFFGLSGVKESDILGQNEKRTYSHRILPMNSKRWSLCLSGHNTAVQQMPHQTTKDWLKIIYSR